MNILETKRLTLRLLKTSDINSLYRVLSEPEVMRYYPHPLNREETKEWIDRSKYHFKKCGHAFYACIHKQSADFIGICGLIPQNDSEGINKTEVGYLFDRRFWNQGFATEASFGCLEYGFSHLRYDELVSVIDPLNLASIRVAEKNGLVFQNTTHRFNKVMLIYSISKDVWEAKAYSKTG